MSSKVITSEPGKREQKKLINPETYNPPQCYKEGNKCIVDKKQTRNLKIPPNK